MKRRKLINAVAVAVMAGAALRLALFFNPRPPAVDLRPHQAIGSLMAAEAVSGLGPEARVVVIAREMAEFKVPAAEAQLVHFRAAVRKAGREVAVERHVKVDPLRAMAVPPGEFFDLIRQSQENDVIVSFLGPPALSDEQVAKLGTKRCRVLAVCPGAMPARVDLQKLFEIKLLTLAIVSRPDAPAAAGPGAPQAAFDQLFKVVNTANLAELSSLTAVKGGER